ncbi:hypothetical protein RAS2_21650 [Phycisphaerae bacterium RAS2]|nr:hypothetical protein RAS2_21650 [Phycisphaerae bacterium RAS2]
MKSIARAPADSLLNVKDVAHRLSVSCRQVWKLLGMGRIPNPVRLNRSVRWNAAHIQLFLDVDCDMAAFQAARGAKPDRREWEARRRAEGGTP